MTEKGKLLENPPSQTYNTILKEQELFTRKHGTPLTLEEIYYYDESNKWRMMRRLVYTVVVLSFIVLILSAGIVCYIEFYYNCYPNVPHLSRDSILVDKLISSSFTPEQEPSSSTSSPQAN